MQLNKRIIILSLIVFLLLICFISYNFLNKRIKLVINPSNKALVLDNWNIYKVRACCEFPTNFKVTNIKKINPELLLNNSYTSQNIFMDPFFLEEESKEKIFYEACYFRKELNYICEIRLSIFKNNKIVHSKSLLSDGTVHSYPQVIKMPNSRNILSITNNFKVPKIYEFKNNELIFQNIPVNEKIMDATYFFHKGLYFMIGTDYDLEHIGNLRIFYGKDPTKEKFIEHPLSPIKVGKNRNRNAGSILKINNKIYRFTMNNERVYGEFINLYEIIELSKKKFSEKLVKKNILSDIYQLSKINKYHHISLKDNNYVNGEVEFLIDGSHRSNVLMHGKKIVNIDKNLKE